MKYGVFGDIQGNEKNLIEMFSIYSKIGIDNFICLGDIIQDGQKFSENMCIEYIKTRGCIYVGGDHDEISDIAEQSGKFYDENILFIDNKPERAKLNNILVFHKSIAGLEKILTIEDAEKEFNKIETEKVYADVNIMFYGHTHKVMGFRKKNDKIYEINLKLDNKIRLNEDCKYLINPGSIGMPDEGRPSFGIFNTETKIFEVRYI